MRYLAIDPGDKRTGLAIGDDVMRMASPLDVITAGNDEQRLMALGKVIEREQPDAVVVGLPLHADGQESAGSSKARKLAEVIEARFGVKVHLFDERLTSFAADQQMNQSGLTRDQKKARRDALAAAAILNDFFASLDV